MRVLKHLPTVILVCALTGLGTFAFWGLFRNVAIMKAMKANAAEQPNAFTEYDLSDYVVLAPKAGGPYTGIQIEVLTGDIVLVKGVYETPILPRDEIEVIRLTHDGFVVVGKHKIHIDTLAAVIETLAIKYQKK